MRKSLVLLAVILISVTFKTYAEDLVLFRDSPASLSYDSSWGTAEGASFLKLVGEKLPVDENVYYSGMNSLRVEWISKKEGDWRCAIAGPGWPLNDISDFKMISFWIYSENKFDKADMPVVFIEDSQNNQSQRLKLSDYCASLPAKKWVNVIIPLKAFTGINDLKRVKTVCLAQNLPDGREHSMAIDELRFIKDDKQEEKTPPDVPSGITVKGYDLHIEIAWKPNREDNLRGYNIYRKNRNEWVKAGTVDRDVNCFSDFLGKNGEKAIYRISAFDANNNESAPSGELTGATRKVPFQDNELMDMVQRATFRYFFDYAHPACGMTRERSGSKDLVTMGGSGMGVMAIIVGIERKYITREQGVERIVKILDFISKADRYHGAWPHWLDGNTGKTIVFGEDDDGADLVETAYMIAGLLTAKQYFKKDNAEEAKIRETVSRLWQEVEWDWFRQKPDSNFLYWHWSPRVGWKINLPIQGPNEAMITYLLAMASTTHGVPADCFYKGWYANDFNKQEKSYYGYPIHTYSLNGGPLFFSHYSYLGFDPRFADKNGLSFFVENKNQTLMNRAYCIENPKGFSGYGADCWGLTASYNPFGYGAQSPDSDNDNGTITPSAALSSFPYTPKESMEALKGFYRHYGKRLWGAYGFKDAFNPKLGWYYGGYVAIDQGPILLMMENHRSGLIWKLFMANPEIQAMLKKAEFEPVKKK